ncbi:MAG: Dam family site-specific DNA-(adenine-N6)-methyltransferase [Candidatus Eremiobacteraeota bacterium]|nr:Dam family site-specific DNA-(adenine-N6)-methyltransferase [Candidatus Eremiobacteraeota bacterium]
MSCRPFLRWAGSKRALLPQIREWFPPQWKCFHEPFLGSGALYFSLAPCFAYLSDLNSRLTITYGAVQRDLAKVLDSLRVYAAAYEKHAEAFYYHVRDSIDPDTMEDHELAAWFIFMNKAGFNGLYRENSSGKYNVPAGKFANPPVICDEETLTACKAALGPATILNCDFRETERRAAAGDFVYCDSPYAPTSDTADFTKYTKDDFDLADQRALRDMAARLKAKGVHVLLSNADTSVVRELYAGWEMREIQRSGGINSAVDKRGKVGELLIR